MKLKQQVIGINTFLTHIYGREIRLSTLLSDLGFSEQQIRLLRDHHIEQIVTNLITLLKKQITTQDNRYHIISRLFGLDGHAPVAVDVLSAQLGISVEQAKQLEQEILNDCKSEVSQQLLRVNLLAIARSLVGDVNQPEKSGILARFAQTKKLSSPHRTSSKGTKRRTKRKNRDLSTTDWFGLGGVEDWPTPALQHDPRQFTDGLPKCPHGVPITRCCAICDPEGFREEMGYF